MKIYAQCKRIPLSQNSSSKLMQMNFSGRCYDSSQLSLIYENLSEKHSELAQQEAVPSVKRYKVQKLSCNILQLLVNDTIQIVVRLSLDLRISPTRIMSIHFLRSRGGGRGGEEGCWGGGRTSVNIYRNPFHWIGLVDPAPCHAISALS